jgi:lysylphosphatidylglycerol synthetase-like protein (DUF2156 family)
MRVRISAIMATLLDKRCYWSPSGRDAVAYLLHHALARVALGAPVAAFDACSALL